MGVRSLLRIAARNLRRNRRRSVISLVALFLALSIMVTMKGFNNSINRLVRDVLVEQTTGALQVHKKGYSQSIVATPLELDLPADAAFLARLRAVPHVTAVAPRLPAGGMALAHDSSVFAAILALDPNEELKVCPKRYAELSEGQPLQAQSPTSGALSQLLLGRIGARIGERVTLFSSDRDGVPNAVDIEVTGKLKSAGVFASEKKLAFVPLASAQELFRMPGRATELAVRIDDLGRVDEVAASLRGLLGPEFEVVTWQELAAFDKEASKMRDASSAFLTYVFLFVALLGITNTMLMSVRERTREIGTMMALGMRRRDILTLFLTEASLLGSLGSLLGLCAGYALTAYLGANGLRLPNDDGSGINEFHPFVTTSYLAGLFLIGVLGAMAAALPPALRASRLRPIQALSQVAT